MANKYEQLGKTASEKYINDGVPLEETIEKQAAQENLNDEETKRVVENANTKTFLNLFKEAEGEATFTFDLANPSDIIGEKSATINSTVTKEAEDFIEKKASDKEGDNTMPDDYAFSPSTKSDVFGELKNSVKNHNEKVAKSQKKLKDQRELKKIARKTSNYVERTEDKKFDLRIDGEQHRSDFKKIAFDLYKQGYQQDDLKSVVDNTKRISDRTRQIGEKLLKEAYNERYSEIREWAERNDLGKESSNSQVVKQDNPISNKLREINEWKEKVSEIKEAEKIATEVLNKIASLTSDDEWLEGMLTELDISIN